MPVEVIHNAPKFYYYYICLLRGPKYADLQTSHACMPSQQPGENSNTPWHPTPTPVSICLSVSLFHLDTELGQCCRHFTGPAAQCPHDQHLLLPSHLRNTPVNAL